MLWYFLLCRLWKIILFLIAVWKVVVGWQPTLNLAFGERKGRMKKTPCCSSHLPFSDSEINRWQYDDFLMSEVWVTSEQHKGKISSCNLLWSGQLNRFRASSSCLYLSWIIGDEKYIFVVLAPVSLFQIKSHRDL